MLSDPARPAFPQLPSLADPCRFSIPENVEMSLYSAGFIRAADHHLSLNDGMPIDVQLVPLSPFPAPSPIPRGGRAPPAWNLPSRSRSMRGRH